MLKKQKVSIAEKNGLWFVTRSGRWIWSPDQILVPVGNLWLDLEPLDTEVYSGLFGFRNFSDAAEAAVKA